MGPLIGDVKLVIYNVRPDPGPSPGPGPITDPSYDFSHIPYDRRYETSHM